MLYWWSNTETTACIDYTNCLGRSMLYWRSNTGTTTSVDYTNGALDVACYIGGATLE